jgi:nicotinate-nucleotide adenylyltransferase
MKIGIFGGTFNPIHIAHVHWARQYLKHFGLDKVLIIPTSTPPHKEAPGIADSRHRLEMCRLATIDEPGLAVCDYEIQRGGISYTLDTLRYLRGQEPDAELCLLMGADMFLTVQDWREPREIFRLAALYACARAEGEYEKMLAHKPILEAMGARCELLAAEPMPMSSTEVRRLIKDGTGGDMGAYLHPAVWRYIRENKLYGA